MPDTNIKDRKVPRWISILVLGAVGSFALIMIISILGAKNKDNSIVSPAKTPAIPASAQQDPSAAQKELTDFMDLSKKAGLITTYKFSDRESVVYADSTWYTQTVQFKKDFLAKIATLKKVITGYAHFEVHDAYSDEKVAEVTAFSGSLEVYK